MQMVPLQTMGGAAQALDLRACSAVRAVGEIQAGDVHARAHQVANHPFGNRRPDRSYRRFLRGAGI